MVVDRIEKAVREEFFLRVERLLGKHVKEVQWLEGEKRLLGKCIERVERLLGKSVHSQFSLRSIEMKRLYDILAEI